MFFLQFSRCGRHPVASSDMVSSASITIEGVQPVLHIRWKKLRVVAVLIAAMAEDSPPPAEAADSH